MWPCSYTRSLDQNRYRPVNLRQSGNMGDIFRVLDSVKYLGIWESGIAG